MKILVIQCAALGFEFWEERKSATFWNDLKPRPAKTVFPAVTCSVQASFRTAAPPSEHGMVANGFFDPVLRKAMFWEQSSKLYSGARIWESFRSGGGSVGQICWQQSLGTDSDLILSPAPIHKHHGGMIQDFFAKPADLYHNLVAEVGRKFKLQSYWGPLASEASTKWIADATIELLKSGGAADLQLVYLPHLDYELQKTGPRSEKAAAAFATLESALSALISEAKTAGYEILLFGDYAMGSAKGAAYPNKILRDAGIMHTRNIAGMAYPDLYTSKAFALCDHQTAFLHFQEDATPAEIAETAKLFDGVEGVRQVLTKESPGEGPAAFADHPRSGSIILEADEGFWFAYPWWEDKREAPDYATHVDIHNKPGYDPCELFAALWPPFSVSMDTSKIGGTHGDPRDPVLLASSFDLGDADSIISTAAALKAILS